jgi:transcriptional regulator of acetoin/glycerol metabolism
LGEVIVALGLDNVARAIASAREQFLQGEQPCGPIRDEIVTSWRRSALSGADPDVSTFPYSADLDLDGRLARAAYPVLDRLAEHLGETKTAVLLADKHARILHRWAADPELHRMMDRSDSAPGFSLIEDVCGTNGLGSVVEERRAMYVRGPEHFAERFISYACYGAPIINPLTGHLEGAVTLVCHTLDASPLMMPFVQQMSGAIEERLRCFATRRERALLDAFTKAAHGARRPVIAVNEKTVITNPQASRLLEGVEHAILWEYAAAAIAERRPTQGGLRVQLGVEISATFRPLVDGGEVLGAIGELDPTAVPSASATTVAAAPRRSGARLLELVGGCSRSWAHTLELTERAACTHEPILLIGETGSGKLHLARAVHQLSGRATPLSVFDAALAQVDGAGVWLRRVRQRLELAGTLVLRHLEALDQRTALALSSLLEGLDGRPSDRPQVIGLFTCAEVDDGLTATGPHVDRIGVHRIVVPPLRQRPADIPDLVNAIAAGLGQTNIAVSSDALQALMRSPWPGNVRQLASIVRSAVAGRTCGTIGLADLPTEVIEGKVTTFTGFEKAEYQAIVQALKQAAGNKKVAAAELGIARSTLYRKLRTYCIDLDRTRL